MNFCCALRATTDSQACCTLTAAFIWASVQPCGRFSLITVDAHHSFTHAVFIRVPSVRSPLVNTLPNCFAKNMADFNRWSLVKAIASCCRCIGSHNMDPNPSEHVDLEIKISTLTKKQTPIELLLENLLGSFAVVWSFEIPGFEV